MPVFVSLCVKCLKWKNQRFFIKNKAQLSCRRGGNVASKTSLIQHEARYQVTRLPGYDGKIISMDPGSDFKYMQGFFLQIYAKCLDFQGFSF